MPSARSIARPSSTRRNLERLCSAFRNHNGGCPVYPCNLELKSFLLLFHHVSERITASGMMCEYERTMLLVRTLPARMRMKAVGQLRLDPLQPSTFRYAIARIAAEENLELFELLDPDTTLPVLPAAATEPPTAPAVTNRPPQPRPPNLPPSPTRPPRLPPTRLPLPPP